MKRFTETEKWHDPWFRSLPAPSKLVFMYLTDRCNNAGFMELDKELLIILTKLKADHLEGALKALARGIIIKDGWVWVRRFLHHQKNDEINPSNPAHKQIISMLKEQLDRFGDNELFKSFIAQYLPLFGQAPSKGLRSPIGIGIGKGIREKKLFKKPSLEEVFTYGKEIGLSKEICESWFDHFESNGWKVGGKTLMVEWKASLRNAKRNPFNNERQHKAEPELKIVA